jgi:NAD(P)-dependent dehydrogenase (short-subunit alcohol dehydrogenase family)
MVDMSTRDATLVDMSTTLAVVTGGTRGIGKAIARGLAERGIEVIVGARDVTTGSAAAAELGARFHALDMASETSISAFVESLAREHGRLDILINNAGLGDRPRSAFEVSAADMRRVYETNVFGVVAMIQACYPLLAKSAAGRIVNVSSERGSLTSERAFATQPNMAYSSSKTALGAVTKHFAYQLDKLGSAIKINAAAPGHCATAFNNFSGTRTLEQGAAIAIELALIGADGPNGGFFSDAGPVAW